jgi:hypothetical protein
MCRTLLFLLVLMPAASSFGGDQPASPLSSAEARQAVGREIRVEMTVRAAKDRLVKRGEIYLDSESDFKDPNNFAVVITRNGAASLLEAGVTDPVGHFQGKLIRAAGMVKVVDAVPRIEIDDAKQIQLVEIK